MIDITDALKKINFVNRYQAICTNHHDFDNRLRGNNLELYNRVLTRLGYTAKYFKKETFYKIEQSIEPFVFTLHLVLKDGIVEPILYIKKMGVLCTPDGRLDFIPETMGIDFDREKYNIPSYTSEEDLACLLRDIFSIYEDLKLELF